MSPWHVDHDRIGLPGLCSRVGFHEEVQILWAMREWAGRSFDRFLALKGIDHAS
jgi:hypothetical protein